jgi:hypothetical protein
MIDENNTTEKQVGRSRVRAGEVHRDVLQVLGWRRRAGKK